MSTKPQNKYNPSAHVIYNGRPAYAQDAIDIDKHSTWLAASWRPLLPVMITEPKVSGLTFTLDVFLPPYVQHLAIGWLCSGRGAITASCDQDSYSVTTGPVAVGTGLSGSHSLDDAQWVWCSEPYALVSASGLTRAFDLTLDSDVSLAVVDWAITDHSPGVETLKVYAVQIFAPLLYPATALP